MSAATHPGRRRPYRLIYQADTSWAIQNSRDAADYLHGNVGFLETTRVDALFWHDGSGGNNACYDSGVLELNGARIGKVEPLLLRMIEEGNDPPAIVVKAAKQRGADVFYSFRLNDCHDSIRDGEAHPQLIPTFKVEHPEWLIGKGHPYGGCMQLNFAVPEVRDLKFAVVEEAARKYDFDGFEIDFQRSAPFFIPGTEPGNAPILTGFLRRVRRHLEVRGEERGRPFTLAVRVPESMEACRLEGFDVPCWTGEGLIDLLVLGSGAIDIEVERFKRLAEGTGIRVYPCLYGWPSGYGPFTSETCRGLAANFWHQGADGIYTFNWNAHTWTQRPGGKDQRRFAHQVELLREIDDPGRLRGKDKEFSAERLERRSFAYPHNLLHAALPLRLAAGESAEVPVLVGEELDSPPLPQRIELRVELAEASAPGGLELAVNGRSAGPQLREGAAITCSLGLEHLVTGRNRVRVSARGAAAKVEKIWIRLFF